MAKADKTVFFCKECGYESAKWLGQCPGCKEVGTFVEEPKGPKNKIIRRTNNIYSIFAPFLNFLCSYQIHLFR